jgi:hypothetical protein
MDIFKSVIDCDLDLLLEKDLAELLDHEPWIRYKEDIEITINNALEDIHEVDGYAYIKINSKYNIISKLARNSTWNLGYKGTIVLNTGFGNLAQTYFRVDENTSNNLDIPGLIDSLKKIGVNAGGKKVVMGSFYPPDRIDEVMEMVLRSASIEERLIW